MKIFLRFSFFTLLIFAITGTATAATKVELKSPEFVIPLNISAGDQATSAMLFGTNLIIAATVESTSNGFASAALYSYGIDGAKQWELLIPGESIAGPLTKDKLGNIYLLGSTVSALPTPVASPVISDQAVINPDNVQTEQPITPKNSLTNLIVWKISNSGQLIQSYQLPVDEVVIPKTINLAPTGLIIAAATAKKYLQVSMSIDGTFGKPALIKSPKSVDLSGEFKAGTNKLKFFISNKSINGIPSWKPKRPIPVLIQYSKFGSIKGANYFQGSAQFVLFQANTGVIVGCESTTGVGISIVKPLN